MPNALIGRDLLVDFMPDDEAILNFTNRWYRDALQTAADYALPSGTLIRVVTPSYFLATKLEAYRGRGRNDPLGSRDIEDILAVVDGRDSLHAELAQTEPALQHYIAHAISALLASNRRGKNSYFSAWKPSPCFQQPSNGNDPIHHVSQRLSSMP
ncbi:hypothetical protein FBY03_11554 [Pseudomonas sp. SJZ079]|uniref:hypothetical protein n=1 Tax=Pseudomonas sp. SJZ079 TaxID=2572887 RepID=UPI0011999C90|nr:hypothetical protein [Pseudomonas sp. SJZ079]TWC33214.1 hypothetical protein FBY03_11554 [Pseudomonas sp. SJZ079]